MCAAVKQHAKTFSIWVLVQSFYGFNNTEKNQQQQKSAFQAMLLLKPSRYGTLMHASYSLVAYFFYSL